MPHVRAFHGYRFAPDRIASHDDVITPPFDVISPRQRQTLAALSPHNMVHLILPESEEEGGDRYAAAAKHLNDWIESGVLARDPEPSYYLLQQRFHDNAGHDHVRRAFFASVKIPEPGEDGVLGHERTFPHKIKDRLALTQACASNMGGIFVMYFDRDHLLKSFLDQTEERPSDAAAETIDGAMAKLWRVDNDPAVEAFFAEQTLYIADGHHRFATAVAYRDEMRAKHPSDDLQPWDFVMMGLVNFDDPGLLVYPAHRMLALDDAYSRDAFFEALAPYFDVEAMDADRAARHVEEAEACEFAFVEHDTAHLLRLKPETDRAAFLESDHGESWLNLDVSVLHAGVLERCMGLSPDAELTYEPDTEAVLRTVRENDRAAAFLLRGATPDQIKDCADAGEFMPQKATYLYPKLPTGAVLHLLRNA